MIVDIAGAGEALRVAVGKLAPEPHIQENVNHALSCFVLMNSSNLSSQAQQKLIATVQKLFPPLYTLCQEDSLRLSVAVTTKILKEKIPETSSIGDARSAAAWDGIATKIFSGLIDFLEEKSDGLRKERVAETFYPLLRDFFFSPPFTFKMSAELRNNAYALLSETVNAHASNQSKLRDQEILGGERIGLVLSRTRDFLLIESLLTLVAWLLPSTKQTTSGRAKRTQFVNEVFGSPKVFKCSAEIVEILENVSTSAWEYTAAKVTDALARSDITFPQPFSLTEIDACGTIFPQPTEFDNLVMDSRAFLGNVIGNGDTFESLKVPYASVISVIVDRNPVSVPNGRALITVQLNKAPLVADTLIKTDEGQEPYLKFFLHSEDLSRFMEALRRRGVGKLSFPGGPPKKATKPRQSIFVASGVKFEGHGSSSPVAPGSSFEDKVKHVEQVYQTNECEDTTSLDPPLQYLPAPSPPIPQGSNRPTGRTISQESETKARPIVSKDPAGIPGPHAKYIPGQPPALVSAPTTPTSVSSKPNAFLSVKATSKSIFGGSDDELSEISEDEPAQALPPPALLPTWRRSHPKDKNAKESTAKTLPVARPLRSGRINNCDSEGPKAPLGEKGHEKASIRVPVITPDTDDLPVMAKTSAFLEETLGDVRSSSTAYLGEQASAASARHSDSTKVMTICADKHQDDTEPTAALLPKTEAMDVPTRKDKLALKSYDPIENKRDTKRAPIPAIDKESANEVGSLAHHKPVSTRIKPRGKKPATGKISKASLAITDAVATVSESTHTSESTSAVPPPREITPPVKLAGARRKREVAPSHSVTEGMNSEAPLRKKPRGVIAYANAKEIVEPRTLDQGSDSRRRKTGRSVKPTRKYGKRARGSSPAIAHPEVDYDEVPGVTKKTKPEPMPSAPQTRAATTRGANGKVDLVRPSTTAQVKPDPNAVNLSGSLASDHANEGHLIDSTDVCAIASTSNTSPMIQQPPTVPTTREKVTEGPAENPPIKRIIASPPPAKATAPVLQHASNKGLRKAKATKAPWEAAEFMATHARPGNDSTTTYVPPASDAISVDDDSVSSGSPPLYTYIEYLSPLKGSEDSVALVKTPVQESTPRKDVMMIDLTQDGTPVRKEKTSTRKQAMLVQMEAPDQKPDDAESLLRRPSATEVQGDDEGIDEIIRVDSAADGLAKDDAANIENSRKRHSVTFASRAELLSPSPTPASTRAHPRVQDAHHARDRLTSTVSFRARIRGIMLEYATGSPDPRARVSTPGLQKEPLVIEEEVLSPIPIQNFAEKPNPHSSYLALKGLPIPPKPNREENRTHHTSGGSSHALPKQLVMQQSDSRRNDRNASQGRQKHSTVDDDGSMQEIVNVLHDIQKVIINGISSKFDTVKKEVSLGRNRLLQDSIRDLLELSTKIARHFNAMIALEEEYAKFRRNATHHWENLIKSNEGTSAALIQALQEHDRSISSKAFPGSILPTNPAFMKMRRGA
ncbi:hypothetical protein BV22DRAFT_1115973 [Leucogyrophana mollusca]|uniref:Uncharacterized protein n=1 Tax=Leucogyrophana mollusca TaxID=85980 RepID=A0ACB8BY28_9AGAM|nr:hypothetical protein BV22DRAFT_1115973 [Leucogyrophana mollusca]